MKKIFFLVFFSLFFPLAFAAICGDLSCDASGGENKCTCPTDCGACAGSVAGKLCMYYSCDPTSSFCQTLTQYPCCGNNICEVGENFANCSWDCAPKALTVAIWDFDETKHFLRGDKVVFKAFVTGDGVPVKEGSIAATGPFSQMKLYDDGNHADNKKSDGVYANTLSIDRSIAKGTHSVIVNAEKLGVSASKTIKLIVDPVLDFPVSASKSQMVLGDIISFSGSAKRRGKPVLQQISFSAADENSNPIAGFSQSIVPDENGNFSFDYHTSMIEPIGEWAVSAEVSDEFGNIGSFQKKIKVAAPGTAMFLDLEFLFPPEDQDSVFERGDEVKLLAGLVFEGEPLSEAKVTAVFADSYSVELSESAPGKYTGKFEIPFDFPTGIVELRGIASKEIERTNYNGAALARLIIKEAQIKIAVVEPSVNVFAVGETINFSLSLKYSSGAAATGTAFTAIASDGREIALKETRPGNFEGTVSIIASDLNGFGVSFNAVDSFGNKGAKSIPFEIMESRSLFFYFLTDPLLVVFILLGIIILVVLLFFVFRLRKRLSALEKRRAELAKLREELQENYFSRGVIDKAEYYNLMSQYTNELERINATIDSMKRARETPQPQEEKQDSLSAGAISRVEETKPVETNASDYSLDLFSVKPIEEKKEPEKQKGVFGFLKKKKGGENGA